METLLPLYHRFGDSLEYTYLICLYKVSCQTRPFSKKRPGNLICTAAGAERLVGAGVHPQLPEHRCRPDFLRCSHGTSTATVRQSDWFSLSSTICAVQVVSIWLQGSILGTLLNYMVDKDPVAEAHKKEMEALRQVARRKYAAFSVCGACLHRGLDAVH